jgi:hypothetical protein
VCSGLSDGSAKERLDTMYGLYQVVKHQYDRLYWKSDTWETDSESESESEDDHEDHQSRVRRFRETFAMASGGKRQPGSKTSIEPTAQSCCPKRDS